MQYVKLGNTGLDVSKICLGCMNFGDASGRYTWALDELKSHDIIKRSLELGINFFDTANIYSYGSSEEYLGSAIKRFANRDEVVIATKLFRPLSMGPNSGGLSRKSIMIEIDKSLARLNMDYIDLYIVHRFDQETPVEETMEALDRLVKSGKVRYIGASTMYAWQFYKMLNVSEKYNYTKFVSMQNHYNLIYREEEREMIPLCISEKIAITPYSPLAAGRLSRTEGIKTSRSESDNLANEKYEINLKDDKKIIDRIAELAERRGISRSQVALAWLLQQPGITSPIIGATKIPQLDDNVSATDIVLESSEIEYLKEPYVPHNIYGYK